MIKGIIKSIILKYSPGLWHGLSSYRFSRLCKNRFEKIQDQFEKYLFPDGDIFVLTGPFKGMKYFNRIVWGSIIPKWVGSYEEELHSIIEELSTSSYETIVDIGGAEGYYAVGFSIMFPLTQVHVFDIDPIARSRQRELSEINGLENLEIRKSCSHEKLSEIMIGRSLVVCDIEGFEFELLNPDKVLQLVDADILVELHAFENRSAVDVRNSLVSRFDDSHSIVLVPCVSRDPEKYRKLVPKFSQCSNDDIATAIDETRDRDQEWLWMKSKRIKGG